MTDMNDFNRNFFEQLGFNQTFSFNGEEMFIAEVQKEVEHQHCPPGGMFMYSQFGYNLPPRMKVSLACHPSNSSLELNGSEEIVTKVLKMMQGIEDGNS